MDSRTGNSNQNVVFPDVVAQNQVPLLAEPCCKTDEIESTTLRQELWDDRCLSSHNCHPRLLCTLHEADRNLFNDGTVRSVHGHVVEEADGLRACADQIVRAHGNTVYPDRVKLPHHLGDEDLSPDTISMKAQHATLAQVDQTSVMADRKYWPSNLALSCGKSRLQSPG